MQDEEKPVFFFRPWIMGRKLWNLQDVVVVYIYFSEIRFAMYSVHVTTSYSLSTRIDNTTSWRATATVVFVAHSFILFFFYFFRRLEIDYDVDNNNNIIIIIYNAQTTTKTEKTSRVPITIWLVPIAKIQEN